MHSAFQEPQDLQKTAFSKWVNMDLNLQWQQKFANGRQLLASHQTMLEQLKSEIVQERAIAHTKAQEDSQRYKDVELENEQLQTQKTGLARQLKKVESLNSALTERVRVLENEA